VSTARSIDGRIWFGTLDGIAVFDPRKTDPNVGAFPAIVESIRLDGKPAGHGPLRFSSSTRRVEIAFASPTFATPERVRYRYKLADFDREWVESRQGLAVYTNLRPGTYSFHVQASADAVGDAVVPHRRGGHRADAGVAGKFPGHSPSHRRAAEARA
jgi:hypothetical protein